MSVINKMLRDLDQRHAVPGSGADALAQGTVPLAPTGASGLAGTDRGTGSGAGAGGGSAWRRALRGVGWVGWVSAGLAAGWLWQHFATQPVVPVESVLGADVTSWTVFPRSGSQALLAPDAQPAQLPEAGMALRMAARMGRAKTQGVQSAPSVQPTGTLALLPAAVPAASGPRTGQTLEVPPPEALHSLAQRQNQAAAEAVAQAQSLWNSGSREAAMELMAQAVAAAERQARPGGQGQPSSLNWVLDLVRELTRMQMAEGRWVQAVDLLARMEPFLDKQPELWALRANAAQRLGRHADSVHAYTTALQWRAQEPRWLLGAAVSLASLGQTGAATQMAAKAQALGAIRPDVLAYLQQLGVVLPEKPAEK